MCLTIDPLQHSFDNQNYYEPKITRLPKKVYKILYIDPISKNKYTPYRCVFIDFRDEKAVLEEPNMMYHYIHDSWKLKIDVGIHAFYDKDAAFARLTSLSYGNYAVFEAIIPPFTKYFMGVDGDIVCKKLIIENKTI